MSDAHEGAFGNAVTDEIVGHAFLSTYFSPMNKLREVSIRRMQSMPEAYNYLKEQERFIAQLANSISRASDEARTRPDVYQQERHSLEEDLRDLNRSGELSTGADRTIDDRLRTICAEQLFVPADHGPWEERAIAYIGRQVRVAFFKRSYANPVEAFFAVTESLLQHR